MNAILSQKVIWNYAYSPFNLKLIYLEELKLSKIEIFGRRAQ